MCKLGGKGNQATVAYSVVKAKGDRHVSVSQMEAYFHKAHHGKLHAMWINAVPVLHLRLHGLPPRCHACPMQPESRIGSEPKIEHAVACMKTWPWCYDSHSLLHKHKQDPKWTGCRQSVVLGYCRHTASKLSSEGMLPWQNIQCRGQRHTSMAQRYRAKQRSIRAQPHRPVGLLGPVGLGLESAWFPATTSVNLHGSLQSQA